MTIKLNRGLLPIFILIMFFIASCEKEPVDGGGGGTDSDITSITLSSTSGTEFVVNTETSFVVKNNKNEIVTEEAEIFVGDTRLSESSYTFSEKGVFEVYAKYKELTSNKLSITVKQPASGTSKTEFTSKVLVQDFTGTWCGYCAAALIELNQKEEKFPGKLIPLEIHGGGSGPVSGDVFDFPDSSPFKVEGYPSIWYNFNKDHEYFADQDITTYVSNKIKTGLAINYDASSGSVTVRAKSDKTLNGRKIAVYIVEGGLVANQTNYDNNDPSSPAYQKGDIIENFQYNNVARAALTQSPLGDVITTANSNELEMEFKLDSVTGKVKDMSKTKIVAVLLEADGKYINAQSAVANENKDFD